jgi:hypothetical protein
MSQTQIMIILCSLIDIRLQKYCPYFSTRNAIICVFIPYHIGFSFTNLVLFQTLFMNMKALLSVVRRYPSQKPFKYAGQ